MMPHVGGGAGPSVRMGQFSGASTDAPSSGDMNVPPHGAAAYGQPSASGGAATGGFASTGDVHRPSYGDVGGATRGYGTGRTPFVSVGGTHFKGTSSLGGTGLYGHGMPPQRRKVPPPFKCSRGEDLVHFFKIFEKYVSREYSMDREDWRLVLPEYLGGDLFSTVQSFRAQESYDVIKAKLLRDFVQHDRITGNDYSNLLDAKKLEGETITCFRIRLEGMAERLGLDENGRKALIIKALERNTEDSVLKDIQKVRVLMGDISISKYIEMYKEFGKLNIADTNKPPHEVAAVELTHNNDFQARPVVVCYMCGNEGHYARDCSFNKPSSIVCLTCGKSGHVKSQCPTQSGTENSSDNPLLYCGYCGKPGHAMVHCRDFNNFMKSHGGNFRGRRDARFASRGGASNRSYVPRASSGIPSPSRPSVQKYDPLN